jgi:hypothetical protein
MGKTKAVADKDVNLGTMIRDLERSKADRSGGALVIGKDGQLRNATKAEHLAYAKEFIHDIISNAKRNDVKPLPGEVACKFEDMSYGLHLEKGITANANPRLKPRQRRIVPARVKAYVEGFTEALKASRARNVKIRLVELVQQVEPKRKHPIGDVEVYDLLSRWSSAGPLNSLQAALGQMDESRKTSGRLVGYEPRGDGHPLGFALTLTLIRF